MTEFSDLNSIEFDYTIHGNFPKPTIKLKPSDLEGSPDISPCGTTFFNNFQAPGKTSILNNSNFEFAPSTDKKIRRIQTQKSIDSIDLGETHGGSNQLELKSQITQDTKAKPLGLSQKEKVVIQKQQRDLYSQIQSSSNEKSPEKRKEAKNLYHFYDKKV